ncbi:hypothetical protein MMC09_006048 [Bachmanniomyces sp. S44760]|nr:hypothetical protein [Bachmanniomyces sp. S44760]
MSHETRTIQTRWLQPEHRKPQSNRSLVQRFYVDDTRYMFLPPGEFPKFPPSNIRNNGSVKRFFDSPLAQASDAFECWPHICWEYIGDHERRDYGIGQPSKEYLNDPRRRLHPTEPRKKSQPPLRLTTSPDGTTVPLNRLTLWDLASDGIISHRRKQRRLRTNLDGSRRTLNNPSGQATNAEFWQGRERTRDKRNSVQE